MSNKKIILLGFILLICVVSISSVSASQLNNTDDNILLTEVNMDNESLGTNISTLNYDDCKYGALDDIKSSNNYILNVDEKIAVKTGNLGVIYGTLLNNNEPVVNITIHVNFNDRIAFVTTDDEGRFSFTFTGDRFPIYNIIFTFTDSNGNDIKDACFVFNS